MLFVFLYGSYDHGLLIGELLSMLLPGQNVMCFGVFLLADGLMCYLPKKSENIVTN